MIYKVAVIGAGNISLHHMNAIRSMEQLQAVGIADNKKETVKSAAAEFEINGYTDYREMVISERPDIVVITLPHFLHKEAAIWCAEQGCHILLEKPMALNVEECDEIIAATASNQVKLLVNHTQHYISDNIMAKKIIQEGTLGELVMINDIRHVNYYSPNRPDWFFEKSKAGGGIFMNLGSHAVDKIQWLTDSRIASVRASISFHGNKGNIEGSGMAFIQTQSGVPATICQSGYEGVNRNETELIFSNGMMKLSTGLGLWISKQGKYQRVKTNPIDQSFILPFLELIQSIECATEPECSGTYGKGIIAVVQAMYESHSSGKEMIMCELEGIV